ncbi:MAG: tyrosine-protein phosphatase [bacterium]
MSRVESWKRRWVLILLSAAVTASFFGGYRAAMEALARSWFLNYDVVVPGRLLRSAQPLPGDLELIKDTHGLGTIISLLYKEEESVIEWARREDVKILVLKMHADVPPTEDQVGFFFDVMRGDTVEFKDYGDTVRKHYGVGGSTARLPFPVLIHCRGGSDRTGVMVALYRIAFQNWSIEKAKQEMASRLHLSFAHPRQFEYIEKVAPGLTPYYGSKSASSDFLPENGRTAP